MKFRCERDTLADAIGTAQRAVASRTGAPPILADLRFEATDDGVEIVGSDLEITIRVRVPAQVDRPGVAVLPKMVGDFVKALPSDQVVDVDVEGDQARITGGTSSTVLRLKAASDYPRLTGVDAPGVTVDAAAFTGALHQVVRAASRDDMRPILTGVLMAATPRGLRLVATDSYRLAVRDLAGVSVLEEGQRVLVAANGLREVERLAGEGDIEIVFGERDVVFRTGRAEITTRLVEGEFPNYEQLIPTGYPNRLTVDKDAFADTVKRVMVVGQGRDNAAVRLAMSEAGLELSVVAQEIGSSHDSLSAKYEGSDLTIAFNPHFLLDGIDAIDGPEVTLETLDDLKPATLRSGEGGDFLYLLMPVRTS